MTKEEILKVAEEKRVKFVRLQFTDILGTLKNVAIPVEQLSHALDGEVMFDGSSIQGFTRIQESDMYLRPDFDTFTLFPWRPQEGGVARLICDIYTPEGKPFIGDPRYVLKRAIAEAKEMGFSLYAGPEPEFFLFHRDEEGYPTTRTHDRGGYFDLSPIDLGEDTRRDIVLALDQMGFEVETSHHEVAPGQHEIDFKYTDALRTADNVATFKFVTKSIAQKMGLYATFMPKPIYGINGSGMHVHLSLFSNGTNIFYDPEKRLNLSDTAYHFIGGLMKHAKAFTAITNPTINSYKRLVPGHEAPVYICWSAQNRSALIRIPAADGDKTRVELRNPDPSANPYLALAVMLTAGLDGIKKKINPEYPSSDNIYAMTPDELKKAGIDSLPPNLMEAINLLKTDPLIIDCLGPHVFEHFVKAKEIEWNTYRTQVHSWELERYLSIL